MIKTLQTRSLIEYNSVHFSIFDKPKIYSFLQSFISDPKMNSQISTLDIQSLRAGKKKAYEEVYNEFFGVLYHLSINYLHDEKVAEEIVQDTFLKLWEIKETLNDQTNIKNFLYTITKNNCLNYLRNQKISLKHQENIKYLEMQFNYEALDKLGNYFQFEELRDKIEESILKLPAEVIETFKLSRFEELSYKEIAARQNISIKTVEARISKALRILRVELKDYLPLLYLVTRLFT
ncbi:MAG TPA: RNA polymerase sigma-70 factor [Prolixibacteraceae bacterium]|nr:RNA polymerase sigma-70 factor [Prolixibacteraceae bacterium]